jgi:uncharacterized phiE125 gp8 family phage protein
VSGTLVQLAQSGIEPVSLEEARVHLRVETEAEDVLIVGLIGAAREWAEVVTRRALVTTTYRLDLSEWPCDEITLPRPPLKTLTSVKYYDTANVLQTWAASNYQVSAPVGPWAPRAEIELAYGVIWPTTYPREDAIQITFDAGYVDFPKALKAALLILLTHLFEHRGDASQELPPAARALLSPYISRESLP